MFTPTDPASSIRWFSVSNTHNTAAPPFAAMQITGVDTDTGDVTVTRPSADSKPLICFNGPIEIPAGGQGVATTDLPAQVAYNSGSGTPAVNSPPDSWGTATDSWLLSKGKYGLFAWGDVDPTNDVGLFGRAVVVDVTFSVATCEIVATYGGL